MGKNDKRRIQEQSGAYSFTKNKKRTPCKNDQTLTYRDYVVKKLLDYNDNDQYLVKWRDFPEPYNTWEPRSNINNCTILLKKLFFERRQFHYNLKKRLVGRTTNFDDLPLIPPDPRSLEEQLEEYFVYHDEIKDWEIRKCMSDHGTNFRRPIVSGREFSSLMWDVIHHVASSSENMKLREVLIKYQIWTKKQQVNFELRSWAVEMTTLSNRRPLIRVENHVDLETKPSYFQFINKSDDSGVDIPGEVDTGCECNNECLSKSDSCCGVNNGSLFVYNRSGRLIAPPGTPIYECNANCSCGPDCHNRHVQDGVECLKKMEYCVFRKPDNLGWCVKTIKNIRRGSFVSLIVGEIVTANEATRREESVEDETVGKYIFSLDFFNNNNSTFAVDFTQKGNISHFINHSCNPNLAVYPVWVNHRNPNVPQLALFSLEDIPANSELTYSYVDVSSMKTELKKYKKGQCPPGFKDCLCFSENCVKYMNFSS